MKRIHLIAPAGSLQSFYNHLGIGSGTEMLALFRDFVGDEFELSGNLQIMDAKEDELSGGRQDDDMRARDITDALADENVAAIVAVRGGAWFTRILPKISLAGLDRRPTPVTVLGFSELSGLVNVIAQHPMGRGIHDMGPAFLVYGLKRHAEKTLGLSECTDPTPEQWMRNKLRFYVNAYLGSTSRLLKGEPGSRITAHVARGRLEDGAQATFVGGNLTVLSTMLGSMFAASIAPEGHWLLLEDFNDKPERMDRFLAHFTLAAYWQRCEGLLLGDFHRGDTDLLPAVLAMLEYHIGNPDFPVLTTRQIGHTWPMIPLPLHRLGRWRQDPQGNFEWVVE